MNITIPNKPLCGEVKAPESKSFAHRYLIAGYLSKYPECVSLTNESDDVMATKNGIETILGAKDGEVVTVDCKDSGTTLRFLFPIACALGVDTKFMMYKSLANRPTEPLYHALEKHGAIIKELDYEDEKCIRVRSAIRPGDYEIPGSISSQFISGLLFALPLLRGESTITVKGIFQSRSYVNMTIAVIREAGIEVFEEETVEDGEHKVVYRIPGFQTYSLYHKVQLEGDWSNAAFWLMAGALSGPVKCTGINMNSMQGDKVILDIIKKMGAKVEEGEDFVIVSKAPLKAVEVDIADTPDIAPEIALLSSLAEGQTRILNKERLKYKETNRLATIQRTLDDLFTETDDDVIRLNSFADHRIIMMGAIAACISNKPVEIIGAEAVNKSYPHFFDELNRLM